MNELLNQTVLRVSISDDRLHLHFETVRGLHCYMMEGDCCAHAFIQHISGVQAMQGAVVLAIEEKATTPLSDEGYDVVDVFGYVLRTTLGFFDIEMRVEHNGYYGGKARYMGTIPLVYTKQLLEDF